ncbi:MAG: bifunctional nuclease family protein [Firmicutes bacterium]|jgi:bifunctional DNase/RNase|nr:bifunctional nuclease family protein [Bacillota bacterium]
MQTLPVEVHGVAVDSNGNNMVILRETEGGKFLPIVVGPFEAQVILLYLQGLTPERPLTHHLMVEFCRRVGAKVEQVTITDLRNEVFYADVEISINGDRFVLDARPSDAIALALAFKAPMAMHFKLVEFTIDPEQINTLPEQ